MRYLVKASMALSLFGGSGRYAHFVDDNNQRFEHDVENPRCIGFVPTTKEAKSRLEEYGMKPVIRNDSGLVVYR